MGADPAALQHREAFPRERGNDRSFLHAVAKTTKAILEEYAGERSHDELKQMISRLKERKFAHLIFSLRHPFDIEHK